MIGEASGSRGEEEIYNRGPIRGKGLIEWVRTSLTRSCFLETPESMSYSILLCYSTHSTTNGTKVDAQSGENI